MRPSLETLNTLAAMNRHDDVSPLADYPKLGNGLYAVAFLQPDGTVLKISRAREGTMDYIEWCYRRLKKYGKGSPEMAWLPEVEHFGHTENGWWAVMPCFISMDEHERRTRTRAYVDDVAKCAVKLIRKVFPQPAYAGLDIHRGNVMFDPKREMWIVTDPLCDESDGSGSSAPLVPHVRTAAWKRSPLQQLANRR